MNFKPNEFFIGLVDFISVILPGSLLTAILLGVEANGKEGIYTYYKGDTSIALWIAFIFVSFGLGHFLNSIASGIDWFYDWIRKQLFPYKENILEKFNKVKNREDTSFDNYFEEFKSNIFRKSGHFFFELEPEVFRDGIKIEESFEVALSIRNEHLGIKSKATNVYKWSQALLDSYFPAVAEQVNRYMAVSKFFRSLVLVSLLFILFSLLGFLPSSIPWWPGFVLLILSFREYIVQRQKSVIATYKGIVSLFHTSENLGKLNK